jgi:hypothetical protein
MTRNKLLLLLWDLRSLAFEAEGRDSGIVARTEKAIAWLEDEVSRTWAGPKDCTGDLEKAWVLR